MVDCLAGNRGRTIFAPRGAARVCRRYARIRVRTFGRYGPSSRKHLLYDRRQWIRTERRGKDTHSPSRHTGRQTAYRGAYPTHDITRKGGRLHDTKYPRQDRKRHERGRSNNVEKTVWRHRTVRGGGGKDRRLRYIDGQTPTALSQIERNLLAFGYVIYSIDYTQDFSGVLDRKALGQYLCNVHEFRERDKLYSTMKDGTPTILANTRTVGNTYARGYTTRPTDIRPRRRCTTRSFPNSKRERSKQSLVAGCESTWTVLVPIYAKHSSTPTDKNEDVLVARSLAMRVEAASCLVQRPKRS